MGKASSNNKTSLTIWPLAAVALLSIIWGYNWVVMKVAITYCPPLLFATLRVWLGAVALFPLIIWMKRPLRMPSARYIIPFGLLQSTGFIGLALWALEYSGAGKAAILVYMMPIWLIVFAWPLLGEKLHGLQWPAVVLALVGLIAILKPWSLGGDWIGSVIALASGILWAASALWQKRYAPPDMDLFNSILWQTIFGGFGLLGMTVCLEPLTIHWTPVFVGAWLYNGIPGTALAYFLWAYALQKLPSGIAGMGTLAAPPISVFFAWLQLDETPGGWESVGMICIVFALALASWQHLRPREPREQNTAILPEGLE